MGSMIEMEVLGRRGKDGGVLARAEAKDLFERLTGQGYRAFGVPPGGGAGELIKEIDKTTEKVIMVPRISGG
jgi:hypothetical protein